MSDPSVVPNPVPTPAPRANPVASAVPAASVPKPMDPIMGTYVESVPGAGDWHIECGGKPLSDWSGIDPSAAKPKKTVFQSRPFRADYQPKNYLNRTTGLKLPHKRGMSVADLRLDVWKHLVKHGLDTITYLPSPSDPNQMMSVVKDYPKFSINLDTATSSAKSLAQSYDWLDVENSEAAKEFLMASLETSLRRTVEKNEEENESFASLFIRVMKTLSSTSSKHFDDLKDKFRAVNLRNYAGENVREMALDLKDIAKELLSANKFDQSLTEHLLFSLTDPNKCSVEGLFRHSVLDKYQLVAKEVAKCSHMSPDDAEQYMSQQELDIVSILRFLTDIYDSLHNNDRWPPSKLPQDKSTIPKGLNALFPPASNHESSAGVTKAMVDKLLAVLKASVPSAPDQSSSKVKQNGASPDTHPCHKCGKLGHWANKCPEKKGGNSAGASKGGTRPSRVWKTTPPTQGEAEQKKVGKHLFQWCDKCKRWSTTHGTDSHTGGVKSKNPDLAAAANLAFDPSVWVLESMSEGECTSMATPSLVPWYIKFYFVITYVVMVWYFMPNFNAMQHLKAFALSSVLPAFGKMSLTIWSIAVTDLLPVVHCIMALPLSCCLGPLLWIALTFGAWHLGRSSVTNITSAGIRGDCHKVRHHSKKWLKRTHRHLRRQLAHCPSAPTFRLKKRKLLGCPPAPKLTHRKAVNEYAQCVDQATLANPHVKRRFKGKNPPGSHMRHSVHRHYKLQSACGTFHPLHQGLTRSQHRSMMSRRKYAMPSIKVTSDQDFFMSSCIGEKNSKHSTFPIIWDSGASISVTNDRSDFLNFSTNCSISEVAGIGKGRKHQVKGEGDVLLYINDTDGMMRALKVKMCYIPDCNARLISTSQLLKTFPHESIHITSKGLTLSGSKITGTKPIFAPINKKSGLPISIGHRFNEHSLDPFSVQHLHVPVVSPSNTNLSEAEKELLRWHQRLGHISFSKVQHLMQSGVLSASESARRLHTSCCKIKSPPKCAACQFAKQRATSIPGRTTSIVRDRQGVLRSSNLLPGQEISVDHFVCSTKGRLFNSRGKSADKDLYCGGCIFVDHASGFVSIEFQSSLSSHATLASKVSFENMCRDYGVMPQKYLSDNGGAFTSKEFSDHLSAFHQHNRFAGVGAHHHNGHAERAIQTIMSISRAMILHSAMHWPELADTSLWPMAVSHAVFLWNHVPSLSTGLSPSDLFTRSRWKQSRFHDIHVWGCPTYVLDKTIADGKKLPRWKPRSTRCQYLGLSPLHSSSVPLVLNPSTGSITPQFHVVFDDWFATVSSDVASLPDFNSDEWSKMFGDSSFQYMLDDEDLATMRELSQQLEDSLDSKHADFVREQVLEAAEQLRPAQPLPATPSLPHVPSTISEKSVHWRERSPDRAATPASSVPPVMQSPSSSDLSVMIKSQIPSESLKPSEDTAAQVADTPTMRQDDALPPTTGDVNPPPSQSPPLVKAPASPALRRSQRTRKPPARFAMTVLTPPADHYYALLSAFGAFPSISVHNEPTIFAAKKASDPDTLTFDEAMIDGDREKWIEAAEIEIQSLESKNTWKEVPKSSAKSRILPGTWVFRRKRSPDGSIRKYKARYCVRGDLHDQVTDTFAPVIAFSTVRIFLITSIMFKWYTCSIDFSNAFVQAKLDEDIWIHLPRGFRGELKDSCLKLQRSLYGIATAPRLWASHLFKALKSLGFKQSKNDPCLFLKPDIYVIVYVDDTGVAAKHESLVEELIASLEKMGFELTRESTFAEFLGIQYESLSDGKIKLTQSGLIKKIIAATGLTECKPNWTPATKDALGIDPDGPPMNESWSYPSVVGMLLYLSINTRPDICFAVSQVCRFTHNPKQSHASAVKIIVRYLARTIDQGTIVTPIYKLLVDCYVDADFAGLFTFDPSDSPSSAKSRSGYLIKLGNCPLIWKSQLQSTIALSTAEAEYYALSQLMRSLLPICRILEELIQHVAIPKSFSIPSSKIHATVYEDNTSALTLANEQRITSRTRHYHTRWHFFWEHVKSGEVEIVHVATIDQEADYLTKGLPREPFERIRRKVQGW